MNEKTRQETIITLLQKTYPHAHIALHYRTPWELLVAVILSAQCTDVMVNTVTETLFSQYHTLDDYCHADLKKFEQDIRKTGFYHNKAKHILDAAHIIHTRFHGSVPQTMEALLTLPGVARKTANVVLGNAYHVVEGIAVDTHVIRLSQRLRLVPLDVIGGKHGALIGNHIDFYKDANPNKIEQELMKIIPKHHWFSLTYQLIDHGRAVCKAQRPTCSLCPLASMCPVRRPHT